MRNGILATAFAAALAGAACHGVEFRVDGYAVTIWTTSDGLPENDVTAVVRTADGYLLVGTQNHGLATFNGVSFRPVPLDGGVSPRVHQILVTDDGTPIVSFLGGWIGAFQNGRIVVERRPQDAEEPIRWLLDRSLGAGGAGECFLTRGRTVVCRSDTSGLISWQLATAGELAGMPRLPDLEATKDHGRVSDGGGGTWIVTDAGLRYEAANGATAMVDAERLGFDVTKAQCLAADNEGNLWLGLRRQGLARVRPTLFRPPLLASGGVLAVGAASLCEDAGGTIWMTSPGGAVWRADAPDGRQGFVPVVEAVRPATDSSVIAAAVKNGGVWVATKFAGLFRIENGEREKFTGAMTFAPGGNSMLEVDGTLWVAGITGLTGIDLGNGKVRDVHVAAEFGPEPLFIESLAPATEGGLWVGGSYSRLLHRAADGTCTLHTAPWSRPGGRFWALLADTSIPGRETKGGVWIGTLGHGLVWFDAAARRFHAITTAHGLPDDTVCQILADSAGSLWLGTYQGVVRVSLAELAEVIAGVRKTVSCRRFGIDDGLPVAQCSSGRHPGCLVSRDGSLWFATDSGVAMTNPATWPTAPPPPRVVIEEVTIDGHDRRPVETASLSFQPGDRRIEFSFAGLWLANPAEVRYRWRIPGVDSDWVDGGNARTARYDRLPSGRHVFEVGAAHVEGPWGENATRVAFTIPPFLNETTWFRGLVGAAALATAAGIGAAWIRWRHRRRHEAAERTRAVERERSRIAQDLHDDLGASLTEIDLLGALAERSGAASAMAAEHIQELRTRAHRTVAALDEIVWAVNPGNDTLGAFQGYVTDFVEHFLRATPIRWELDLVSGADSLPLSAHVRHAVFQSLKEAVNNVVRHADASSCRVRLRVASGMLEIEVSDDGRGFDPSEPGFRHGDGLKNMNQRMAALRGRCVMKRAPEGGTSVILLAALDAPAGDGEGKQR